MQIVRTVLWILLLVCVLTFSFGNWDKQIDVRIWPGIVWDTRVPALVIVSFLAGLVPMWLYHRGVRWRQGRRITALEQATTKMTTPRAEERPDFSQKPDNTPQIANPVDPEPETRI